MGTTPVLSALPPQQQWATRLSDLLKGAVVNPIQQSAIYRGAQAGLNRLGQAGDDFTNWYANSVPNNPPANQQLLGDLMKTVPGMYGMPLPSNAGANAGSSPDQPKQSIIFPKGGEGEATAPEEDMPLQIAEKQGIKLTGKQQKPDAITKNIETAAKNGNTMLMVYQGDDWDEPRAFHIEPYSYRPGPKDDPDRMRLFVHDTTGPDRNIRGFYTDGIINITPTKLPYTPKWDVEIGKPRVNPEDIKVQEAAKGTNPKAPEPVSDEELDSAASYQDSAFHDINSYLRRGTTPEYPAGTGLNKLDLDRHIGNLDSLIEKQEPFAKDTYVYRGVARPELGYANYTNTELEGKIGTVLKDNGFMSTSKSIQPVIDQGFGGKAGIPILEIKVPAGTKAAYIPDIAASDAQKRFGNAMTNSEQEYLLPRGQSIKLNGFHRDAARRLIWDAELISNEAKAQAATK